MKNCHLGYKAKSLKKVVYETNEIGDSITVKDIVIQKTLGGKSISMARHRLDLQMALE